MSAERAATAARFALILDGSKTVGYLKSVDGGGVKADVITEALGTQFFKKKHIGAPQYEPLTLEFNFNMEQILFDWINNSWKGNYTRKNGSIIAADFNLKPLSEIEFFNAMISEVTFPKLDGSSKETGYFSLKIAPESTRFKKPGASALNKVDTKVQKQWLPSNFRLKIDGLDCRRVQKIDSFTVKQATVTEDLGDARDFMREPTSLEFPNLAITLPEADAQTWLAWHEDFIITGKSGEDNEKSGTLDFLTPNGTTVLGTIHFFNLGIFKLAADKTEANQDQVRQVTAGLYCDRMEFTVK